MRKIYGTAITLFAFAAMGFALATSAMTPAALADGNRVQPAPAVSAPAGTNGGNEWG